MQWEQLNTELDWRDAFNIAKLQSDRKMYLMVSMHESLKKGNRHYSLKMNYKCKPEFFGNRYEERMNMGEEFYRIKQETWKEESMKAKMLTLKKVRILITRTS